MRSVCVFLVALLVTGCSSTSGLQTSEQSFISGNGIVTLIDKSDRDLAPIFAGPLLDGGNFNFAPGKVTVLNVWASWCSPCRAEAPSLEELSIKYPEVQFVGVLTRDNLVAARAFVKRFSITYPTIIDDAILAEFSGLLSVNAIPTTLVIDSSGRLAARISGEITFSSMTELLDRITSE